MDIRDIAEIDAELYDLAAKNPALAARYKELMNGEELGEIVVLPRAPTAEDWAAAERLARSRAR